MKYGRVDITAEGCAGPKSREGFADNAGMDVDLTRGSVG